MTQNPLVGFAFLMNFLTGLTNILNFQDTQCAYCYRTVLSVQDYASQATKKIVKLVRKRVRVNRRGLTI
jgi:hypothetical protein